MRPQGIKGRLERLTERRGSAEVQQLTRRIAEREGIPVEELLAEAERIAGVCQRQGVTTVAGVIQYYADELGIPVADLEAEIGHIRERAA